MRKPGPNYFGFILWVCLIKVVTPVGRFCVFIGREIGYNNLTPVQIKGTDISCDDKFMSPISPPKFRDT